MPVSDLRLIKRCAERIELGRAAEIPYRKRGIYVLLNKSSDGKHYDVVYIGMARNNMKRRIKKHARSRTKSGAWTHFSIYEVHDNIYDAEIAELEGILRHIFSSDTRAMALNMARRYKKLKNIRRNDFTKWVNRQS